MPERSYHFSKVSKNGLKKEKRKQSSPSITDHSGQDFPACPAPLVWNTPPPTPVFYLILLVQKITSIAWISLREDETIVLVFSLSMLAKLKY